jgi:hypothetical protein
MNDQSYSRALLGIHDSLIITKVPAGAQGSLVGNSLLAAGVLTVAGVYECEFRIDGLSKADVRLKATFASGSSTTSGGSTYADRSTTLTAWTGVGAMVTTVEQALTIAAFKGERYAKVIITTVGAVVQFTTAEVIGYGR